jgi:DNA-binding NarL/FixJ family response regulator
MPFAPGQPDMECVGEASNGREALEQFKALRPDVTLLDLNMPEMDGLQALIAIREDSPQARIVVLTTYKGDVLAQRALKAGALECLLGPLAGAVARVELVHDPVNAQYQTLRVLYQSILDLLGRARAGPESAHSPAAGDADDDRDDSATEQRD